MSAATPQRVRAYVTTRLGLRAYLRAPGDGRRWPVIPAEVLLWAQLIGYLLREGAFHAVEALVRSRARRQLGVAQPFSDDALAYFTERLDPSSTRDALVTAVRQAKRNKAFGSHPVAGIASRGLSGTVWPTRSRPRHTVASIDTERDRHAYLGDIWEAEATTSRQRARWASVAVLNEKGRVPPAEDAARSPRGNKTTG